MSDCDATSHFYLCEVLVSSERYLVYFQKYPQDNKVTQVTFRLWWQNTSRGHNSGKTLLYAEILTPYSIMTSTCCACEALPFKRCWKNSTLWKWPALPRALQQRDRKVRAFHAKVQRLALSPAERGGVRDWVSPGHNQDQLFWQETSKTVHTLLSAQGKCGTHAHLFASCDELFVVWSGELRMQRHDLKNNK